MKNIAMAIGTLGLIISAAGCGGDAKLEAWKDKACACKDAACVLEVSNEMTEAIKGVSETEANKKLILEATECIKNVSMK